MQKISNFIVKRRAWILALMLVMTAVCGILMPRVGVNSDMTKYLSSSSQMKKGLDLLEKDFPATGMEYTVRVMFRELTDAQKAELKSSLAAIKNVDSVDYEADSADHNNGEYTLFVLKTGFAYDSDEMAELEKTLEGSFKDYDITVRNDDTSAPEIPLTVYLVAFGTILVVLLISCGSFFEPLLFLATIGVAVVLNLGTNIFLGEVSDVTYGISAILQLALSMDYSIILMNRYRQELESAPDRKSAMAKALRAAFASITGSAVTTVVGLLMLLFMSFKIGMDVGIVLAKGVAFSMLCVFTVLPALILLFDRLIVKTEKKKKSPHGERKSPLAALGGFGYRVRRFVAVFFVLLFVGAALLQTKTETIYTLDNNDPITDVFPQDNQIVLVYRNGEETSAGALLSVLEGNTKIKSITSYPTSVGKEYTAAEMTAALSQLGAVAVPDEETIKLVYYLYFQNGEVEPLTLSELVTFLTENRGEGSLLGGYIDSDALAQLSQLKPFTDKASLIAPMTADHIANALGMDAGQTAQLFMLRFGAEYTPEKTMSIYEFLTFLTENVLTNPAYAPMFSDAQKTEMFTAKTLADAAVSVKRFTPAEAVQLLSGTSDKITENTMSLLYLYRESTLSEEVLTQRIKLDVFVSYLNDTVAADERFAPMISEKMKEALREADDQIKEGVRQLKGNLYSRAIISTTYPEESAETTAFIKEISEKCDAYLSGEHYLIGSSVMVYEMENGFEREYLFISILTALAIFIVVALTFRNLAIPAILVLIVQCGVFITVSAIGAFGGSMYYLALIIVECILMGATIDYGIVYTSYYREMRQSMGIKEALIGAYHGSIHTVLTSGSIMVLITAVIGPLFGNPAIEQIVKTLAVGCASAIVLILFILPSLLALLDRWVTPKKKD